MDIRDWIEKEVFPGFKNAIFKKPAIEALFVKRMEICRPCEYRQGPRCSKCGCFLMAKCRSPYSKCPIKKWLSVKI